MPPATWGEGHLQPGPAWDLGHGLARDSSCVNLSGRTMQPAAGGKRKTLTTRLANWHADKRD